MYRKILKIKTLYKNAFFINMSFIVQFQTFCEIDKNDFDKKQSFFLLEQMEKEIFCEIYDI